MTSYLFVLVLYGTLLQVTDAVDCKRHLNTFGKVEGPKVCDFGQSCCGSCKVRLCCPFPSLLELVSSDIINLSEDVQDACPNNLSNMQDIQMFLIVVVVVIGVIFISLIIFCCVCPCCCLYQMCRKPRPTVRTNTHTTVVVNNPGPPQAQHCNSPAPAQQQYPGYQPVPMPPWAGAPAGYGGHPVPSAPPMLDQSYGLGPPPPYQENAVTGGPPTYC